MPELPSVGDVIEVWWKAPPGGARVRKVEPYTGCYTKLFTHDLTIDAPNTTKGELVMSFQAGPAYSPPPRKETP